MRYSYIVPQFFSYHCTQRTIEIIYFLTFCGEKIYLLNHYTLITNMKNIRYEAKKDFLCIKGKTNKNWADPHTFFEKFGIKHFFCENWGDLNTFFFYYLSRGGLKWLISYHLAIQQKVTEKSSYYWTIAPCCTELYT